jgi:hypothetical protein
MGCCGFVEEHIGIVELVLWAESLLWGLQVFGTRGGDCGAVCTHYRQATPPPFWAGSLCLCGQCATSHRLETFISCIDSYVSSGFWGKVLTVMMCCIYHGQVCCRKLVHSDPWAYLKVDIRVKKEKMVVKVKSKTCANGLQHLYWRAYTMSTRIMMDSCISVTVGRKHLAKKDDFILLYLYIGSK